MPRSLPHAGDMTTLGTGRHRTVRTPTRCGSATRSPHLWTTWSPQIRRRRGGGRPAGGRRRPAGCAGCWACRPTSRWIPGTRRRGGGRGPCDRALSAAAGVPVPRLTLRHGVRADRGRQPDLARGCSGSAPLVVGLRCRWRGWRCTGWSTEPRNPSLPGPALALVPQISRPLGWRNEHQHRRRRLPDAAPHPGHRDPRAALGREAGPQEDSTSPTAWARPCRCSSRRPGAASSSTPTATS